MVQWGSKALPSLTLSNMNMPDHKLQPVGRIHRDPSPRPTMTTPCVTPQLAQERVSNREGDWGRERDKARSNDVTPHERYYHPDRATAPRWREGEREWMQSERRPGGDKSRQVRALINVKMYIEKEMERGLKKGETFPRMTNSYGDHGRRKMSDATNDDDRLEKRKRDRQRQTGPGDWERERDREWLIERRREGPKHEIRIKAAEEGIKTRRRPVEDDRMQHRERYNEPESSIHDRRREVDHSRDRREKYAARNRDMGGKGGMTYSPHRQRAVEIDTDRSEREKAQKSGQSRGTRSEGDSVERELRRERARDREKENSKSDGGNNGKRVWEGDGDRYKEDNGQRYTDRDREREVDRSRKREVKKERERYQDVDRREEVRKRREDRERRADLNNDRALLKDREDHDRYKDYRQRKIKKEREADLTWAETTGFQPVNTRAPRVPPRSVSSGEWSSDMDDMTHRRDRGGYDEREPNENKRDAEQKPKRSERHESDTGDVAGRVPDHRRMWLDPQRDKNSKEEVCDRERYKLRKERRREEESMASRTKWVGEGRQGKQDPDEHLDQCRNREREKGRAEYTGETERESEGVSVDGDDVGEVSRDSDDEKEGHLSDGNGWSVDRRTAQTDEHPPDTTEEGDGEEGGVSDRFAKAGCETPWKPQNDRTLSAEAYVTLSSDGGDEEEREEDEDEEFEDCREYSHNGTSPVDVEIGERRELTMGKDEWVDEEQQGAEKQPKYVFCVIGQTLPQSGPGDTSPSEVDQVGHVETHNPELEEYNHCSDDATRQPRGDPYLTVSRNNDDLITSEQNRKDEAEQSASKEVKTATGEAAGAEITYASPALLRDTEETVEDTRGKAEYPCPQITESNRDSQTERLLVQWRGKHKEPAGEQRRQPSPVPRNPYADVPSEVNLEQVLDGINAGVLRSAEAEAVDRSQIVKGWTLCEEPKRHSQAPHLKWAKNVVRDILGNSEEETVDEPNAENQESMIRSGMHGEELVPGAKEGPFIMLTANEQNSEPELQDEDSLEDLRDDEGDWSQTWGGEELKNRLDSPFSRQKRKSKFFKRAQLYQQYNEAAQNLEILTQSGSHIHRLPEFGSQPLAPPPANRPLPPLPSVLHPHSYSFSSVKSLPLPEPPRSEGRPPSPRLSVSFTQSPTLWQDLPGVRNNSELAELTENQRRLQEVQFEVLTSEASYCRSLDIVVEHFVKSKQLGALLTSQDRNWLFSRLSDVRAISHSFLLKLEERVESDLMHFTVCDIIAQHCPRFKKVYVPYLTNQSYQDATYQRLMNENPAFKRIVEKLERNPVCERLPFRSFLILPFQRITRIKLLVQNIVKKTNPGTAEATQAIRAMKLLEKLIQESNDSISQMKNIESLVSLNAKVDFECKTLPLVSQSRRLIREGPVTELMDFSLKDTERNAYLHLFNDFLLVSLQKEGGRFTVIDHSPVKDLRGENCRVKLHTLQKNLFRLHMANRSLLLRSETQSDKLRWLSALSRPYPEVDFSAVKDVTQMQCIRAFVAQQPDELSLDKADIILVHQTCDNWVEGTRLPDCHRGWVPESNLEKITNDKIRERNLSDAIKLTTATAAV
ncbi:uncharacterized protein arhgef5 isoform X2 [Betta splendens]|uniref:Uncharacterized protein arhgef5 isoform X2 n=1 Tax=Betta splendens TaxID=158456 RepID=A0A6P7KQJ7_BETSP|nr:uncharacterized protein arhgef5 isoform X2 [Betta splendens]